MSAPALQISYPPELPVSGAREEIAAAIRDNQVVIVAGATGSGKTTQLPKICLELGRESIAHTQPRRIAARTIAERVAEELHVELGTTVGYKVRFTDKVGADTRVALMTDGILLNEIHRDRLLRRYDTIIVDEAHERSLNVDFLLGYLRRILPDRPDLKVVITSATIDPQSFAEHFADAAGRPAPIIEVSGRTYPVEIRHRPLLADDEVPAYDVDGDEIAGVVAALQELDREPRGDVLVFLPGEAEIRDAADAVRAAYSGAASPTEVLPLFGRLSAAEQHRVFERSTVAGVRRRVVLATNVAETSLTVPGIKYVVDTGTARISRYSNRAKVQRLPIEPVSQASAQQRSGRAGRTSDGIAIRLYGEEDFAGRPEFTEPEILRTSLASVILQMLALGFGDIQAFPFLTPPDSRGVRAALDLLVELGAVTVRAGAEPRLTKTGREIARMPIDPRFARMLIEAQRQGTTDAMLAIVAGLSIQDVRERPEAEREQADRLHARFTDPTSDFLSLLNLWNHLRTRASELGSSAFRRLCRAEHLNYVRVREWFDVHRQLRTLVRHPGGRGGSERAPREETTTADPDAIHRAILSGLLSHIGVLDARALAKASNERRDRRPAPAEYLGARGIRFAVFPGSGLKKKRPQAVMAAELVETSRLFARTVAAIDPAWAEPLAGDLAGRQVSEPHWSKDAGAAVAFEKVTLFGVEIIPRRRIQYARIDRDGARELFVRHALVEGEWDPSVLDKRLSAFVRANHELRRRLEKLEERERRRDILVGDEAVFAFYDARVPRDVFDVRSFERWWREQQSRTPHLLTMRQSDLAPEEARADARDFPTRWVQGDQTLTLAYRFEPGADDDGVNVVVPLPLLQGLRPDGFDWQVPGMRAELIAAMLRALPKAIRRNVVPAADWAARFGDELAGAGPESHEGLPPSAMVDALARLVQRAAGQPVTAADFEVERVPAHLRMAFRVVDGRGRTVGAGRDLAELQARLAGRARESVAARITGAGAAPAARVAGAPGPGAETSGAVVALRERTGITSWDLGDLPEVIDTRVAGGVVRGYPTLVDEGASVALRVESTPEAAERELRRGIRRLMLLAVPSPVSYVQEHLTANEKLALAASPYPSVKALIEDCRAAVADEVIEGAAHGGPVRDAAAFAAVQGAFSAAVVERLFQTVSLTARILTLLRDAEREVRSANSLTLLPALNDVRGQLAGLVFPGFVLRTGTARLGHLPRYLDGALTRLRGLADNAGRDRQRQSEMERALAAYAEAGGTLPPAPDAAASLVRTRWLLEELRVSLFAQQLGTSEPVSLPRIAKALRGG
ncbi:ATP-dependent RNA helicase HrpA [Microbacterium limosum]|uniref:ATP-dependent RNA helicase HrpA n=1 Tax=Microbacterium limosum TaxID=3079935 RepID=A0AAU0MEK9_9MICO|nr:ATP-dependent RNA helicase HrpA [Microbacterium sp. Y20]WOQ68988.1 ATP-dependent RNA helicase HrpA [Microbacterium sp. Y20]